MSANSFDAATFASFWRVTSDPAPGAEAIIIPPGAAQVQLTLLTFTLVTDGNADNRVAFLTMEDGGISFLLGSAAFFHVASTTFNYICHENVSLTSTSVVQDLAIPIPTFRFIDDTATLKINITDINVGDQISNIRTNWKMWRGFST